MYLILIYIIYYIYKYCFLLELFENTLTSKRPRPKVQNYVSLGLFLMHNSCILISCKIRAKIGGQKSRILALLFAGLMNYSYLCIVNRNDGIWAQGTKNLLSGLAKFAACLGKFSCLARAIFFPARCAISVSQFDNAKVRIFHCGSRMCAVVIYTNYH